ncbi:porin family protein [Salibacter halophilus]|uniref:PorT family protein n=1 Tax=Salibacter halophilus TaxID=1803916 RepID=A0A6N6M4A9_9FLAO|nr:porin family protein [Salibacter halophilus]KAB1062812.1 PorT family protein [Salibacter halophilus]
MSKDLDEIFKEGLKDRKVSFNPGAWDKAEAMLNKEQGNSRKGFVWWKAAAAALLLVSLSVGAYFVVDSTSNNQLAEKQETKDSDSQSQNNQEKLSGKDVFEQENDTPKTNQNPKDQLAKEEMKSTFSATSKRNQKRADQMRFAKTSEPNRAAAGQTYPREQSSLSDVKSSSSTEIKQGKRTYSLSEIPLLEKLLSNSKEENSLDHTIYTDKIPDFTPVVKHRFFLIGGGMVSNAYKTGDYSKNYAIDPFGGFGYEYLINPNFSLEADVLYLHRSGVNTTKTIESGEYSFGRVTDIYNINHEVLHYLELPVFANYRIGNNMIKAGVGVSYLINSKSTVEHIHNTPFEQQVSTSTEYGHNDGFNKIDYSVQFGYERLVLNKLNLGVRGSYGFADVVKDDYYNHSAVDNNLNVRIYAKYNLANL